MSETPDVIERATRAMILNIGKGDREATEAAIKVVLEDLARDQNPRMIQRYAREELDIEIDLEADQP